MRTIRVGIVEDNSFFIRVMHNKLVRHSYQLERYWDCNFELFAFSRGAEFLAFDKVELDILFLDYHLDNGMNAAGLIEAKYPISTHHPNIVIVTEDAKTANALSANDPRIAEVIRKDAYVIPRTCIYVEDYTKLELRHDA
ncbi:MAG: hypothetical protein RLP15_08225 [Cryomorphaceae bacterium]